MVGVLDIVAPGGDIIIASACSEGMGSVEFVTAQKSLWRLGPDGFTEMLKGREKAEIDEWQTEMLMKALRVGNVHLYTEGLSSSDLEDIYVKPIPSIKAAILESVKRQGDNRIAVVPEGPYVVPLYKPL
ncbi:MAG: hypothetical protein U5R49_14455 [Deltaproteobacteria bacterium]|nr:hypothetical protein [Deltaproteobacteria bacterium]